MISLPRAVAIAVGLATLAAGCRPRERGLPDAGGPMEARLVAAQEAYYRSEYDSAATRFAELRAEASAAGDDRTVAVVTLWMGMAANARGQWDSARVLEETALALQLAQGLTDLVPRSYNALGLLAWEDFRLADADSLFGESIAAAEGVGNAYFRAVARGNLGLVQQDLGDFDAARAGYREQLAVSLEHDSVRAAATARLNLAILSLREGDPQTAADELSGLVTELEALGDPKRLQNALAQLGEANADLGEPRLAFAAFDSALRVARDNDMSLEVARNLDALAHLHERVGNLTRALEIYQESRVELQARGLAVEGAWNLRNSAAIRASLGDPEGALADALAAAAIHVEAGLPLEQVDDEILLAELADREAYDAGAAAHLDRARAAAASVGHRPSLLRVELVRARFDLDRGRAASAIERLTAAEAWYDSAPAEVRAEGLGLLARAHASVGDLERAADTGYRAVEAVERIRSRFGSAERRATFLDDRVDVYGDLAAALFGLGRVEEGFAVVDAARGRGISARVASARSASTPVAAVAAREEMLLRVSELTAKLDSVADDPYGGAAIRAALERARGAYDDAFRDARERLGVDAVLLGIGDLQAPAVRGALAPGEALVEYLVAEEGVWAVVVTATDIRPLWTPVPRRELAARVRVARDLAAAPENGRDVLRPVMGGLHELLLGPALRSGLLDDVRLLTVVPHGMLNYLPFPALVDPATDRYLVEDFEVRHLPSAAALPALAGRSELPPGARLALFAPLDAELPHTSAEIERIADVVDRERRRRGRAATEASVRSALQDGAWVHLATHAVMNAHNPMFSRIELAEGRADRSRDDGRLEVHEILDLRVRSGLVFLSGCETGVGAAWATVDGRGENQTTLERALLYAGAANVVATLWPIDDRGAAEIAEQFYRSDDPGEAPSARLSRAQRSLLNSPRWASPYYWAGYRLSGTNRLSR